jgi:hypothetical protein
VFGYADALADAVTALPPLVSMLAAFGGTVPPPLPPGADFLAILTAAEATAPEPEAAPETPDVPRSEEPKLPVEKPKKTLPTPEPPPVAWVSVPMAAPQEAPPVPIAFELPLSPGPPLASHEDPQTVAPPETLEVLPPKTPTIATAAPEATEAQEAQEAPVPTKAAAERPDPVLKTSPAVEAPAATPPPADSAPPEPETAPRAMKGRAPQPKPPLQAPPTPDVYPPQESAPVEPSAGPAAATDIAPPTIELAAAPEAKDVERPSPQPELRAKTPLAFGARLVDAKPAHAEAKVSAAEPGSPAPEPQRRSEPQPTEQSKTRAVRAPDDAEIVTDGRREQPAANTPPPRDPPAREAPARADAAPKTEAPKPAAHASELPAEAPKASPTARDIRLEVTGADRKVELRVIERAGEVQVAVRTPDEQLAGTLREHLPLLSSRLEQSGFRADQWRAADAGGTERRLDVQSAAESSGRAPEHRGGNEQRQQQEERRPQPADERKKPQEKGTAFEWLMQSLR